MLPLQSAPSLPVQIVRGVYLGVLTGVIPALVAFSLGFLFRYITNITVPALAVVGLTVAIAGVNGGLLALYDPAVRDSVHETTIVTALLVVMMLALVAHNRGDKLGAELPRRLTLSSLRERRLSADVVEFVGTRNQVRVRVVGVADVEGYPPLPDDLRAEIRDGDWTFPADVPLADLETRFADRLRTEFDLADVSVAIDEQARARVAAAPPSSGVSRTVPADHRAVSVPALVPTGLARGDEVAVHADGTTVRGPVVSARSEGGGVAAPKPVEPVGPAADGATDDADADAPLPAPTRAPTTSGGEGRVTVAVERSVVGDLLRAGRGRVVAASRGVRREYELLSLLRRAGQRIQRVTVREGGALDGATLGDAHVRDAYGVAVLAVRHDGAWTFGPRGSTAVAAGDDLFAVGSRDALDAFREAVA